MTLAMIKSIPGIIRSIDIEKKEAEELVKKYEASLIISDNRYGFYSRKAKSIIITHQVYIRGGIFSPLVHKITARYLSAFDEIWVPDFEQSPGLSGDLSHREKSDQLKFIGPLTRFAPSQKVARRYDYAVVLSGPEPQRTILESMIVEQSKSLNKKGILIQGKPGANTFFNHENLEVHSHLNDETLQDIINGSEILISRPGYSTIMDLVMMHASPVFVPTPGQTEQEYLAWLHSKDGRCIEMRQKEFSLEKAWNASRSKGFEGFQNAATDALSSLKSLIYV